MRVLTGESKDKTQRQTLNIPNDTLIELLKEDHGFHEVIDMFDPNIELRVYFDIEAYNIDTYEVYSKCLELLNSTFQCTSDDWAICSCNRALGKEYKISYHILSKKYKMSLNNLRAMSEKLVKILPYIDTSAYWFSMGYSRDEGSLRLPNQSKNLIHKEGEPLKIIQGSIEDFFVTVTDNLKLFTSS